MDIMNSEFRVLKHSFIKTIKTCSKGQDRCSFHVPGSGSYHERNLNSSKFFYEISLKRKHFKAAYIKYCTPPRFKLNILLKRHFINQLHCPCSQE